MKTGYKNFVIILLGLLLLASIAYQIHREFDRGIVGTYIHGNELSGDALYIVFDSHGAFVKYHQFQILQYGFYESRGDNIYILSANSEASTSVLYKRNTIYTFHEHDEILVFRRMSNIPVFINVEPPELRHAQ